MINSIVPDVSLVKIFRGAAPLILTDPLRLTLPVVFPWPAPLLPTTMG